ncbi:MAG: hypothetical protein AAF236_11245 [Verrucomicrobiota bacterium]
MESPTLLFLGMIGGAVVLLLLIVLATVPGVLREARRNARLNEAKRNREKRTLADPIFLEESARELRGVYLEFPSESVLHRASHEAFDHRYDHLIAGSATAQRQCPGQTASNSAG